MKKNLLPVTLTVLFVAMCFLSHAQNMRDVVSLKNGSVIMGVITEQTPPNQLKIKTADGSILVYKYDEIEKISREEIPALSTVALHEKPDMKSVGGFFSLGVAAGGGGIIGAPVIRFYPSRFIALEAGFYLRPSYIATSETHYNQYGEVTYSDKESKLRFPLMFSGGADVFFHERFNERANMVAKNGMMFRFGKTLTTDYDESMFAIGWARERYKMKHKKTSFVSEVGIGVIFFDYENELFDELDIDIDFMPAIYWKFNWNWFLG